MKMYKALKAFDSPLIGVVNKDDVFQFGADSIKPLLKAGYCVELEKEQKKASKKAKK